MVVAGSLLMTSLAPAPAAAWNNTDLTPETKLALQSAVAAFIDHASDADGGFRYIDRASGRMQTAYPGSMHPKIIPVGDDYFLCIEMLDAAGNPKLVDFLMRRTTVGWLIVDVIFDRRDLVKKAVASVG